MQLEFLINGHYRNESTAQPQLVVPIDGLLRRIVYFNTHAL
jgi:hypothetical protein